MLGLLLLSCGPVPPAPHKILSSEKAQTPPGYLIIFVIHGDGDYLYHDPDGNEHRADIETLAAAKKVAERNSLAEVFIFHEIRRKHLLLFFPRHDGEFYYYRNGQLLAKKLYWRDKGQSYFDPEVKLYYRFHVEELPPPIKLFLYFGHEIPEFGGKGYNASYRDKSFTVQNLADGMKSTTHDSKKFDLVMLSSCFNGTPYTISALAPYARYIIASPGNLHLSYFDLHPFEALDAELRDKDVSAFAKKAAQQAFDRLDNDIQTEITVAVYDVDRVQRYTSSIDSIYNQDLALLINKGSSFIEHCDCAEDPAFLRPAMNEGIDLFYRPARFGRSKNKQSHSGWECYKLTK